MSQKITAAKIEKSLHVANASYWARQSENAAQSKPHQVRTSDDAIQSDITDALRYLAAITDAQWSKINEMGIESAMLKGLQTAPVKVCKRIIQVLAVCAGADASKYLTASARTFFLSVGAVLVASAKNRDGLQWVVSRMGNEHTSENVNLAVARNLQKMGITSPQSFATQNSVSFGKNGMGRLLGVGRKGEQKLDLPIIDATHPVTIAVLSRIASLTEVEMQALSKSDTSE